MAALHTYLEKNKEECDTVVTAPKVYEDGQKLFDEKANPFVGSCRVAMDRLVSNCKEATTAWKEFTVIAEDVQQIKD